MEWNSLRVFGIFGLWEPLRLAGLRLDECFRLFDGLDALPDVLVSVFSVLVEWCGLWAGANATTVAPTPETVCCCGCCCWWWWCCC